jgi:hypothetical protein
VACGIALLNQHGLTTEHGFDSGREIFEVETLGAGNGGVFEFTDSAMEIGDEGELGCHIVGEELAHLLAPLPVFDGLSAAPGGSLFGTVVIADPGGIEGAPAGVGELVQLLEKAGERQEVPGLRRKSEIGQNGLV